MSNLMVLSKNIKSSLKVTIFVVVNFTPTIYHCIRVQMYKDDTKCYFCMKNCLICNILILNRKNISELEKNS